MNWYYAEGDEEAGPFTDENFASLVALGVVKDDTLVRHDRMAGWRAYREIAGSGDVTQKLTGAIANCAQCGRRVPRTELIQWENHLICSDCSPVSVWKACAEGGVSTIAEAIRKAHLEQESEVKSAGVNYIFFGILLAIFAILLLTVMGQPPSSSGRSPSSGVAFRCMLLAGGIFVVLVGIGVLRLQRWARIPVGITSCIGLLFFWRTMEFSWDTLKLIRSEKGKTVFSKRYQEVIAATPHIKCSVRSDVSFWLTVIFGMVVFGMIVFLKSVSGGGR